jgi:hypothetical protein
MPNTVQHYLPCKISTLRSITNNVRPSKHIYPKQINNGTLMGNYRTFIGRLTDDYGQSCFEDIMPSSPWTIGYNQTLDNKLLDIPGSGVLHHTKGFRYASGGLIFNVRVVRDQPCRMTSIHALHDARWNNSFPVILKKSGTFPATSSQFGRG